MSMQSIEQAQVSLLKKLRVWNLLSSFCWMGSVESYQLDTEYILNINDVVPYWRSVVVFDLV